ncbi:FKBP-type peptidyl-prolyl cis-trans isomerase [Formosa sp. S-31]|uniref:FKBP-type peptidyl-prolyl cis-trans isomerase n=1 Tax=Formosa sp. S-31 TaxID=2790949 RepID=UPI003EBA831B
MKYILSAFIVLFMVSCSADDDFSNKDYSEENALEIQAYISNNNLNAYGTNSGLYYVIEEQGSGAAITATSDVTVKYKAMLTDGTVLDENLEDMISLNLQYVIPGWTEGLQYFNEGGSGMLLVPAHLAYGSNDYQDIPGGSVIVFEIEVIDLKVENEKEILDYISENELTAQASDSGLYYVIEEQGTGEQPNSSSEISVIYKGYFTDGTVFDHSNDTGVSFNVSNVIEGFKEGITYFKVGGKGKLLIPSHLAYGRYGSQTIPAGAVLIFDVELLDVN